NDPAAYERVAQKLEDDKRRSREVERCRKLGLAVQKAVKASLEARGLKLTLVDRGFDYRVDVPVEDVLADASSRFEVGAYLLEVKATTQGGARLTPVQAATAAQETGRYVLCVVDLRGVASERLDGLWT